MATHGRVKSNKQFSSEDLEGGPSAVSDLCDYLITGDCSGCWRYLKLGLRNRIHNFIDWQSELQTALALKRKEQEQRAMDLTMEHPFPKIRKMVNSNAFEIVGNFVIFCNTIVVALQADQTEFNTSPEEQILNEIFENFFTFAFVVDLALSTLCWGWTYLVKRENWLDVFLVFLGVLTTWILGPFGIRVEALRKLTALRTLRLIRVARAVRLRPEFKEMWALMKGLTESVETLRLG